ncbi:MAG: hypothetical protein ACYC11_12305, partial [Bellilinea sp.]
MNIADKLKAFQLVNVAQGLSVLLLLAINHSDESHAAILYYSRNKFLLMVLIFIIVLVMSYSLAKSIGAESQSQGESVILYLLKKSALDWVVALSGLGVFIVVIQENSPALWLIIWPMVVWGGLFIVEILMLKIWVGVPITTNLSIHLPKEHEIIIGYGILVIGIAIGYLLRYYGGFVDEDDHITSGWLISKNFILYKDFFSHHPPLVNYWVGWMIDLVGRDLGALRFSMVIMQGMVIGITMRITGYFIPLSLSTLVWIIFSPYYHGNLLLYQVFSGTFIVSSIAVYISIITQKPTLIKFIGLGLLAGLAISSDPQMVWPLVFIYLGILIALIFPGREKISSNVRIYFLVSITLIMLVGILWVAYFTMNDALNELIYDLITFNTEIYSKYTSANIFRLPEILQQAG